MDPHELDSLLYGDEEIDYAEPAAEVPADSPGASLANWHLRKIRTIEAQAEMEDQLFKEEIARLQARRKNRAALHESAADWHRVPLQQWHRTERAAGRLKGKKLNLPAGSAQLRAARQIVTDNEDELRSWLEEHHDPDGSTWAEHVFRQTEQFMVSELTARAKVPAKKDGREPGTVAKLITPEGEAVPGVRVVILPDTWSVSGS